MQFVRKAHISRMQVTGISCENFAEQAEAIWSITSAAFSVLLFCFHRMGKVDLFLDGIPLLCRLGCWKEAGQKSN